MRSGPGKPEKEFLSDSRTSSMIRFFRMSKSRSDRNRRRGIITSSVHDASNEDLCRSSNSERSTEKRSRSSFIHSDRNFRRRPSISLYELSGQFSTSPSNGRRFHRVRSSLFLLNENANKFSTRKRSWPIFGRPMNRGGRSRRSGSSWGCVLERSFVFDRRISTGRVSSSMSAPERARPLDGHFR